MAERALVKTGGSEDLRCFDPFFMKQAVIYCRVSSDKQATEGHGLSSQESSCRKYAADHDFEVLEVFRDDYTGGGNFWRRRGIKALLEFLGSRDGETAVIFDDLKRFARDTKFHLQLRQELSSRNAYPRCPNFRFDESPEGEFVETVIAATAELERKQNRRQVISRMKARLEAGYWVFAPPLGYRFERVRGEKRAVPDPITGQRVRSVLVDFASGKLATQAAAMRYLQAHDCTSRFSKSPKYSKQAIRQLLSNEFYAGWCVCKKWNLRVRGVHEPLIAEEQHRQILQRLEPLRKVSLRTDAREDFPLRGFVRCSPCGRSLTAGWTRGRSDRYPYYRCQRRSCIGSIDREHLTDLFLDKLEGAQPRESSVRLLERVLLDLSNDRELISKQRAEQKHKRLKEIDGEIDSFVKLIRRSANPSVQQIYEQKIVVLQQEKTRLQAPGSKRISVDFEPVLEEGRELLRDPKGSWENGNLRRRQIVQNLVFETPISYDPKEGLCTAEYSLLYRLSGDGEGGESNLVDLLRQNLNPVAKELQRWRKTLEEYSA